ncbi:hypothetical protein MIND_01306000 [Mycena indigotica]|uniref:Uncharacterized protein n=1 Tax=Mycena indigotica TaxID=2126181 RepID=A0A8H6VQU4_9AGAR|nr:uncharacterized protein MIND_01306000 [Mycena indigotica]KAF7290657.1 hypothetical protein MIND_01306000 [Mycena indigotica]
MEAASSTSSWPSNTLSFKRQSDLWYSDGNLIIVAGAGGLGFRVYAQFLAAKSKTFAEMRPTDVIEGIPAVRLDDAEDDVEQFLKAIFDTDHFMPPPSPTKLSTVLAVLRLSHKYDVQFLIRRALRHLNAVYPTTLSEFLAIPSPSHLEYPEPRLAGHVRALKAAMDVDAQWLFPAIHYSISCSPLRSILATQPSWSALSEQTQFFIVTKHAWRLHRFEKVHEGPLNPVDEATCADPRACLRTQATYATRLVAIIGRDQPLDAIRFWDEPGIEGYLKRRCDNCAKGIRERINIMQGMVWDALPRTFEFPEWKILVNMRDLAMARVD